MLTKSQMSEEDIKFNYITPAITAKWPKSRITMETNVTDGKISLKGNLVHRERPKKADYMLYDAYGNPIAVVEAKDNNHSVSFGLQQAIIYAQMMDLSFAYSSNGDAFYEHDFLTGLETKISLDDFPSPDDLATRLNNRQLNPIQLQAESEPYYTSAKTYPPRYYQRVAIDRTIKAIAGGQNRILLAMATGTGKTYTAFQIVYRLIKLGLVKKVLYLADRNFLVDQAISQDFAPLKEVIHKISFASEDRAKITSYQVYFSLYQQLAGNEDENSGEENTAEKLATYFSPDFFDLIIVDECHRGSAKLDSNWRKILDYFSPAAQIGMTATPKETKYISNIDYFGEPIYTYSLKQGIEDGFLAPFKVINVKTNIGEGWRPDRGQKDIYGQEIPDRIYTNSDYDYNIILSDRIEEVARDITAFLKQYGRMQKTIVFCATEDHAERMRIALSNLNSDMVKANPDYVVRITGSDVYGKSKLDYFISASSPYPVIATTSKLLSTGADCKMTKLIVLDEMIGSMTEFKQIIGRGTRIREKEGKTDFTIMDFRNVTRLFSDPDWDGPIEMDPEFDPNKPPVPPKGPNPVPPGGGPPIYKPIVDKNGCKVEITGRLVSIYDANGKLLRQENIIDYTKSNVRGDYASLETFIREWRKSPKKEAIKNMLLEKGIDLEKLKEEQKMSDVDDFDFICHVAYDQKPLTRKERANNVKKRDFLNKYKGTAREILDKLIDKYMNNGIYEIENTEILKIDPFMKYGKPAKIVSIFGGKEAYLSAVKELEEEIYRAG